jgi:alanyl-tRNA synthetase
VRKAFDKQVKEKETAANKDVSRPFPLGFETAILTRVKAVDKLLQHFKENETSEAYIAVLDVDANAKVWKRPFSVYAMLTAETDSSKRCVEW